MPWVRWMATALRSLHPAQHLNMLLLVLLLLLRQRPECVCTLPAHQPCAAAPPPPPLRTIFHTPLLPTDCSDPLHTPARGRAFCPSALRRTGLARPRASAARSTAGCSAFLSAHNCTSTYVLRGSNGCGRSWYCAFPMIYVVQKLYVSLVIMCLCETLFLIVIFLLIKLRYNKNRYLCFCNSFGKTF